MNSTTTAETVEREQLIYELREAGLDVDGNISAAQLTDLYNTHRAQRAADIIEDPAGLDLTPEADDEQEIPADGLAPDPEGKALFDRTQYDREDLAISKVDGNQVDRIALTFSGAIFLDRSSPADVALYNKLLLGHDLTLMVEGKCSKTSAKGATDREGDLDVVVGEKTVKVTTVYIPALDAPEDAS